MLRESAASMLRRWQRLRCGVDEVVRDGVAYGRLSLAVVYLQQQMEQEQERSQEAQQEQEHGHEREQESEGEGERGQAEGEEGQDPLGAGAAPRSGTGALPGPPGTPGVGQGASAHAVALRGLTAAFARVKEAGLHLAYQLVLQVLYCILCSDCAQNRHFLSVQSL